MPCGHTSTTITGRSQGSSRAPSEEALREDNGRTGKLVLDQLAEPERVLVGLGPGQRRGVVPGRRTDVPLVFSGRGPDRAPLVAVFRGLTVDWESAFPGDAELDRAREAVRLAGLSHPRGVVELLADRRYGGDFGGYRALESTSFRGSEEERGR